MFEKINYDNMSEIFIVIPCYNEEKRLDKESFFSFLENNSNISLIFVNDGSQDNTLAKLYSFSRELPERIKVINLDKNMGKGFSVRVGILSGIGEPGCKIIGYLDADLATPLNEAARITDMLVNNESISGILGSRVQLMGRIIKRRLLRYFFSRILSLFTFLIFGIKIYDTQCGAKFFRRHLAENIFRDNFHCQWLFDIELVIRSIHLLKSEDKSCIIEEPLFEWHEKKGSKVTGTDYFLILFELIKLIRYYRKIISN